MSRAGIPAFPPGFAIRTAQQLTPNGPPIPETRGVTARWGDDAARALYVPVIVGQLGLQLDSGVLYRSTAVAAGAWSPVSLADDTVIPEGGSLTLEGTSLSFGFANQTMENVVTGNASMLLVRLQYGAPTSGFGLNTARYSGENTGLEAVNDGDFLGVRFMETWSTGLMGLVNSWSGGSQGVIPPSGWAMLLAMKPDGRIGSIVPLTGVAPPTFRNLLDDGSGNGNTTYRHVASIHATSPTAVAYAATVTPNVDTQGAVFIAALTGGITVANWTGTPVAGQRLRLRFLQDATGGRAISFGTKYLFVAAKPQSLITTTASKYAYVTFEYNEGLDKMICVDVLPDVA